jgi:hypothetical protein
MMSAVHLSCDPAQDDTGEAMRVHDGSLPGAIDMDIFYANSAAHAFGD